LAARKLKQIYNSNSNINATQKHQLYIVNKLKKKLLTGNAMLAQADKGRTTVIIYNEQYTNKIHNFLTENNIQPLHKNPINKDRKHIQEILQQNNLIFNNRQVKYLLQKNPTPPTLNAQLKLHKPNIPI
jgi:nitrous oxidase accessory protein NosD